MIVPSDTAHVIVNVVDSVIGTVAAPPASDLWLKLPSLAVSVQLTTPCALQKIEVRPPKGTDGGEAQISTFGGTVGVDVEVATGVEVARGVGLF